MRWLQPFAAITLAALILGISPAAALHGCNGEILALETPAATLYIDDRSDTAGQINHWFYLESNGIEGLQSGGVIYYCKDCLPLGFAFLDPCWHFDPDTLIL